MREDGLVAVGPSLKYLPPFAYALWRQHVAAGDYITARDIQKNLKIPSPTLRRWHSQGKLQVIKRGNAWYYSREDLLRIIQAGP